MQTVAPPPGGTTRSSNGLRETISLADTTGALAGGGQATHLAMLHDGLADPVDLGIATDGIVVGVNQNDLKVLVGRVLGHPVRVEDTQTSETAANTFLMGRESELCF